GRRLVRPVPRRLRLHGRVLRLPLLAGLAPPQHRRRRRRGDAADHRQDGRIRRQVSPMRVFSSELFSGRVALVTGGGTGLGRVIAQTLAEAGADLLLAARNVERLEIAAAEIRQSTGRRVEVGAVNIRDRETVEALAARADSLFGSIDVLINNA